jgi:hypothetical protein
MEPHLRTFLDLWDSGLMESPHLAYTFTPVMDGTTGLQIQVHVMNVTIPLNRTFSHGNA